MSFLTRHSPQQISDLVFRDATVGGIITDYAQGLRDKHLLLYGPAGSGKSIAAQIILSTQAGDLAGSAVARPINPRDYDHEDFEPLLRDWSAQMLHGVARGYTVIDEVDFFSPHMQQRLRAFIDSTELGTIIVTTNNLHKLDEPFKDRFRKLLVERPSATDWTARAQAILAAEGVMLTAQQVGILLKGFQGSARELIEWLEDYTLTFKRQPPSATATVNLNNTPCSIKVLPNKTLINGHSLTNAQGVKK
ncbi:ATP-binding protein [Yoonia sp.]|uniref:ATP-binding protein n=1 Tax=Yoonia sp. TaxID=2212373 RepID=UPI004047FEF1